MARLSIGIVGCGTAGQAAAIALSRAGHAVALFERFAAPGPVGAGLLLQPSGLLALARLDLLAAALALGQPIARLHGVSAQGRTVLDLRYADHAPDAFGLGLHRAALFHLLHGALRGEPVRLTFGAWISAIEAPARPVLRTQDGECHGPFDLVVVAEGSKSPLRAALFPEAQAPTYPWGALWTICADEAGDFPHTLEQHYDGARIMVGILPVGRLPNDPPERRSVSLFWSLKLSALEAWRTAGLATWKRDLTRRWPRVEPLLATLDDADALAVADYRDVQLRVPYRERVVFIGDAAHGTSPQLGQGANLALIDALVLARALQRHDSDVPAALRTYERARRAHVNYYRFASRWLTPLFQSDARLPALLRDWFMGPLGRLPIIRSEMIATLVGLRQGVWGRFDPRSL